MKKGTYVIIRCKDAGVHCGEYRGRNGREVKLKHGRRIWHWRGAHTLSEIAAEGLDTADSRVSVPVRRVVLLEACEILEVTPAAKAALDTAGWLEGGE